MAKKYKKMTQKEKAVNKKIRDQLRADGVLPPVKPKLNRKKYVEETREAWNVQSDYKMRMYLTSAISVVLGLKDSQHRVSPEAIGAAKVLRIAIRLMEFENELEKEGRTTYKVSEQYEYIKDILDA